MEPTGVVTHKSTLSCKTNLKTVRLAGDHASLKSAGVLIDLRKLRRYSSAYWRRGERNDKQQHGHRGPPPQRDRHSAILQFIDDSAVREILQNAAVDDVLSQDDCDRARTVRSTHANPRRAGGLH